MKIVWATLENEDCTSTLKQHAYKSYLRGGIYSEKYEGNKQLCARGGVHDGDKFLKIEEINSEDKKDNCCKSCEKIFKKNLY